MCSTVSAVGLIKYPLNCLHLKASEFIMWDGNSLALIRCSSDSFRIHFCFREYEYPVYKTDLMAFTVPMNAFVPEAMLRNWKATVV